MALPIAALGAGVGDGVAAVDHHPIAHIDAHMGSVAGVWGVVGVVEEDQVPRLRLVGRDDVADIFQPPGTQPAHVPAIAAVVDDPRHEAGAVKTCAGGTAAPDIGVSTFFKSQLKKLQQKTYNRYAYTYNIHIL